MPPIRERWLSALQGPQQGPLATLLLQNAHLNAPTTIFVCAVCWGKAVHDLQAFVTCCDTPCLATPQASKLTWQRRWVEAPQGAPGDHEPPAIALFKQHFKGSRCTATTCNFVVPTESLTTADVQATQQHAAAATRENLKKRGAAATQQTPQTQHGSDLKQARPAAPQATHACIRPSPCPKSHTYAAVTCNFPSMVNFFCHRWRCSLLPPCQGSACASP